MLGSQHKRPKPTFWELTAWWGDKGVTDLDWVGLLNYPFGEEVSGLGEPPTLFPHPALPHTHEDAPDLVGPPLNAHHEHAGDSQREEGAPVLQALAGPA